MAKVKMLGLYGKKEYNSYYRRNGACFDFVSDIKYASEMSNDEAKKVVESSDWYCRQFGASSMEIVNN